MTPSMEIPTINGTFVDKIVVSVADSSKSWNNDWPSSEFTEGSETDES